MTYWRFADGVKDELAALSLLIQSAYNDLESEDDPGELADGLAEIKKRLDKLSEQLGPAIPTLRKAAAALEAIPAFKGV